LQLYKTKKENASVGNIRHISGISRAKILGAWPLRAPVSNHLGRSQWRGLQSVMKHETAYRWLAPELLAVGTGKPYSAAEDRLGMSMSDGSPPGYSDKSDVYAAGIIGFEVVEQKCPWSSRKTSSVTSDSLHEDKERDKSSQKHQDKTIAAILGGSRPSIAGGSHQSIIGHHRHRHICRLILKSWRSDPASRPSSLYIYKRLQYILHEVVTDNTALSKLKEPAHMARNPLLGIGRQRD